jgi:hypothetical protein
MQTQEICFSALELVWYLACKLKFAREGIQEITTRACNVGALLLIGKVVSVQTKATRIYMFFLNGNAWQVYCTTTLASRLWGNTSHFIKVKNYF